MEAALQEELLAEENLYPLGVLGKEIRSDFREQSQNFTGAPSMKEAFN